MSELDDPVAPEMSPRDLTALFRSRCEWWDAVENALLSGVTIVLEPAMPRCVQAILVGDAILVDALSFGDRGRVTALVAELDRWKFLRSAGAATPS